MKVIIPLFTNSSLNSKILYSFFKATGLLCVVIGISGFTMDSLFWASSVKYFGCLYILSNLFSILAAIVSKISLYFSIVRFNMPIYVLFNTKCEVFCFIIGYTFNFLLELVICILNLIIQLYISFYYLNNTYLFKDKLEIDVNKY